MNFQARTPSLRAHRMARGAATLGGAHELDAALWSKAFCLWGCTFGFAKRPA